MNSSPNKNSAFLGVLFYLYYALLALLSFAFLYFEKEVVITIIPETLEDWL